MSQLGGWHQWVEAREAVEHPSVPRSAPQQRITCRPNVNSSEFEKPCYSHFGGYFIDFPALIVIQLFSKLCFCCVSIIFSLAILGTATSLRLLQIPYMNCMEKNLNLEKIILFSLDSPPYSVVKLNLHLLLFDSTQGLSLLEVKDRSDFSQAAPCSFGVCLLTRRSPNFSPTDCPRTSGERSFSPILHLPPPRRGSPTSLATCGWSNSFMQAASLRNSSMSLEAIMSAGRKGGRE